MNKVYCPCCNKYVEYDLRESVIREHKGYIVNVKEEIPVCKICGKDIFIPEIEEKNFKRLYDKYREVANIISPEEIITFRNKYKISQRELVQLLGWGKMTINRYERGAIPSQSHNDILELIISNENFFKEKVEEAYNEDLITDKTYKRIARYLEESDEYNKRIQLINSLSYKESEYNGFRRLDLDKVITLISYLSDKTDLYKTSLNKYLWYIDFENFKRNVRSITGLTYMRYTYGPVIKDKKYEDILQIPNDKFYKEEHEDGCMTITKIKSTGKYDLSIFKKDELKVINDVLNKFKRLNVNTISELSHSEDAWIKLFDGDIISYDYADKLKIEF